MRTVVRSRQADEDLIAIWLRIAVQDPAAANRCLDAIEQRWQYLPLHPWSGVARDDIMPGLRHLIVRHYLILYRVSDEAIDILRVLHGRRKLDDRIVTETA